MKALAFQQSNTTISSGACLVSATLSIDGYASASSNGSLAATDIVLCATPTGAFTLKNANAPASLRFGPILLTLDSVNVDTASPTPLQIGGCLTVNVKGDSQRSFQFKQLSLKSYGTVVLPSGNITYAGIGCAAPTGSQAPVKGASLESASGTILPTADGSALNITIAATFAVDSQAYSATLGLSGVNVRVPLDSGFDPSIDLSNVALTPDSLNNTKIFDHYLAACRRRLRKASRRLPCHRVGRPLLFASAFTLIPGKTVWRYRLCQCLCCIAAEIRPGSVGKSSIRKAHVEGSGCGRY